MTSAAKRVSADTVVNAIRALMRGPSGRTGRAAVLGYLALKAREATLGQKIEVRSSGPDSVKSELDRFFGVAPGSSTPYINPFGTRAGRLEWLAAGYERAGVYTHLAYGGRTLGPFVDVDKAPDVLRVRIPPNAAANIAGELKGRIPLEPAAAFLLRDEPFSGTADTEELVHRFQDVFHLSDEERDALFIHDPSLAVEFDMAGFVNSIASLPDDLYPLPPSAGHAGAALAAQTVSDVAPPHFQTLVFDEPVMRRARRALAREKAIAFVGPPGTGKSQLTEQLLREARSNPTSFGLSKAPDADRHTAETDWTARVLIGGHYPQPDGRLVFQEGYLLAAIRQNRWLILDEMNRADLDRVLGPILTFLAGQSVDLPLTELTDQGKPMLLQWGIDPDSGVDEDGPLRTYIAGTDWRILGTYNNVDVGRVFSMGSALMRRWATIPVPPVSSEQAALILSEIGGLPHGVPESIRQLYVLHLAMLRMGVAPFVDMARYVADDGSLPAPIGVVPEAAALAASDHLRDAYVLHIGPQLRRLDPDTRDDFFRRLGDILGKELSDELRDF